MEQIPENCHQAVRDHQRTQRRKHIGVSAVYDQCITSGQLERRSVAVPDAPTTKMAEESFRRQSVSDRRHKDRIPREWPKKWNRIMDVQKDWTSLSVPVCLSASLSWLTALSHYRDSNEARLGNSWWSRLMKAGQAFRCGEELVLAFGVGRFAALGEARPDRAHSVVLPAGLSDRIATRKQLDPRRESR